MRNPKNPFPEMSEAFWQEEYRREREYQASKRNGRSALEAIEREWAANGVDADYITAQFTALQREGGQR